MAESGRASGGEYGETYEIWLSPVDPEVASSSCGGEDWSLGGAKVRGEVPSYSKSGASCAATVFVCKQPVVLVSSPEPWNPTLLNGDGKPFPELLVTRAPNGWQRGLRGPVEVSGGRLLGAVSKCLYQILCRDPRSGLLTPDVIVAREDVKCLVPQLPPESLRVSAIVPAAVFSEYFLYSLGLLELSGVPNETLSSILRLMWSQGVIYNVPAAREVYPGPCLEVLGCYTREGDFVSAASPEALDIEDSLYVRTSRLGEWGILQRWGLIPTRHTGGATRCLLFPLDMKTWGGIARGTHGESIVFTDRCSSGMRWWPVSPGPRAGRILSSFPQARSEVPRVEFSTFGGGTSDHPVIGQAPIPYDLNLCHQSALGEYSFGCLKIGVFRHTTLGSGSCAGTLSTIGELQGEFHQAWDPLLPVGVGTSRGKWMVLGETAIIMKRTPLAGWARRCSLLADMFSLLYVALLVSALVQGLGGGASSIIFTAEVAAEVASRLSAGLGETIYGGGTLSDVVVSMAAPLHWSISRYAETDLSGAYLWRTPLRVEAASGLVALGAMCVLASSGGSQEVSPANAILLSIVGGVVTVLGGALGLPTLREVVGLEVQTGLSDVLVLYAALYFYGLVVQAVFLSSALPVTGVILVTVPGVIESLSAMHAAFTAARAIDRLVEPAAFVEVLETGSMKGCVSMLGGSDSLRRAPSILRLAVNEKEECTICASSILSMYEADVYGARFGKLSDDNPPVYCLHWETARSTDHLEFDVRMGNANSWAEVRPVVETGTSGGTIGEASCSNAVVAHGRTKNRTGFVAVQFSGNWYPVFAGGAGGHDLAEDGKLKG